MSIKGKARRLQFFCRDLLNLIRYGRYGRINVPRSFETLWVVPNQVRLTYGFRRRYSGRVIGGDWDINAKPIDTNKKLKLCRYKFNSGVSWEESGMVALMLDEINKHGEQLDNCYGLEDVVKRNKQLDGIFEELREGGSFKTMRELKPDNYREYGGPVIHVGREGQLLFSGAGCHRLAMAQSLDLPLIPVQIGVCHPQAIKSGYLGLLRSRKPK